MNKAKVVQSNHWMESRGWETLFFFSEAVMIVFYCVGTTFGAGGHTYSTNPIKIAAENAQANHDMIKYYPMWQDINVMVFIGFGYLMAFLKTHSWSSIGFNFLAAAWAIQCTIIFYGFWY